MQGSIIDFTSDAGNISTFYNYKSHPADRHKYDKKNKIVKMFEEKRKLMLRRPIAKKA